MKLTIAALASALMAFELPCARAFELVATNDTAIATRIEKDNGFNGINTPSLGTGSGDCHGLKTRQSGSSLYVDAQPDGPADDMATFNGVDFEHRVDKGDWLMVQTPQRLAASQPYVPDTRKVGHSPSGFHAIQQVQPERVKEASSSFEDLSKLDTFDAFIEEKLLTTLPSTYRLWIHVRQPIDLSDLARQLRVSLSTMASLNGVDTNHRFRQGDWIVFPAEQRRAAIQVPALDSREIRRTPPSPQTPASVPTKGVVRFGDTLFQIAQRYGMTMQDILRLNPGLDTARLVAGTEIQLVQAAPPPRPRAVLGLLPSTSGGLSWPDAPEYRRQESQQSLVRPSSPVAPLPSASELDRTTLRTLNSRQQLPTAKPLSERETALLQQIRSGHSYAWRVYGKCKYDWGNWKMLGDEIRATSADCGGPING